MSMLSKRGSSGSLRASLRVLAQNASKSAGSSQAFIFDMDGTLVDNMGIHGTVWAETLARQGVTIDPGEFNRQTAGRTNPEIFRMMLARDLTEAELAALAHEKESLYRERYTPI